MRMFALGLAALSALGCSGNVLSSFADKKTDEAYLEDAKIAMNDGDYDGALSKLALIKGSLASDRRTLVVKASAYGGLCGMPRFLDFAQAISGMGTARVFPFLTALFVGGSAARIDMCKQAESALVSIGATADRTPDENMFLVFVSFAKIGNVLSLYTDANQDGAPDAGVDPCLHARATRPTAPVAGNFYDADLRELGTGVTLALANIAAVSSTVQLGDATLASLNSVCTALGSLPGLGASYNFCSVTDPSAFTAQHLKGLLAMLKESSVIGLGTNCTGDLTACNCGP